MRSGINVCGSTWVVPSMVHVLLSSTSAPRHSLGSTAMIASIDELVHYSRQAARNQSGARARRLLSCPGISLQERKRLLAALPLLPPEYLGAIEQIDVNRGAFGYFQLGPSMQRDFNLVDNLVEANDAEISRFASDCHKDRAYLVAWCDGDPIGLAHSNGTFERDTLVMYDDGNIDAPPEILADNYLQFLFLAGNLDEIYNRYFGLHTPEVGMTEFSACLDSLAPSKSTRRFWLAYAADTLDDSFMD